MNIEVLLSLLGVGFSGFVIALAYLSFTLLNTEQKKQKPNTEVLASAKSFRNFALILIFPVVGMMMIENFLKYTSISGVNPQHVSKCRDSLSSLVTQGNQGSGDALLIAINTHEALCKGVLENIDDKFGF